MLNFRLTLLKIFHLFDKSDRKKIYLITLRKLVYKNSALENDLLAIISSLFNSISISKKIKISKKMQKILKIHKNSHIFIKSAG